MLAELCLTYRPSQNFHDFWMPLHEPCGTLSLHRNETSRSQKYVRDNSSVLNIFHFKVLKVTAKYLKDYDTSGPHGPPAGRAGLFSYPEGCAFTLEIKFSAWNSKFKLNIYRTGKLSRYHSGTLHGPCGGTTACFAINKMVFRFCISSQKPCRLILVCGTRQETRRSKSLYIYIYIRTYIYKLSTI